jgi:hypothetical protein
MIPRECHFGADRTLRGVTLTNTILLDPEGKYTAYFPECKGGGAPITDH